MTTTLRSCTWVIVCASLVACGQVGPLYLPGQAPPSQQAPAHAEQSSPAPAPAPPGDDEEAQNPNPNAVTSSPAQPTPTKP